MSQEARRGWARAWCGVVKSGEAMGLGTRWVGDGHGVGSKDESRAWLSYLGGR